MEITKDWKAIQIDSSCLELRRLESGLVNIRANNPIDLQKGLGFVHAHDRIMQMLVTRIVGRGELTKYFLDTEEGYAVDLLVRKLGFRRDILQDLHVLTPEVLQWTQAYCDGVNAYLKKEGLPFLCKLFKVKSDPWTVADTLLIMKTLSYIGIAQQQERIERLIIHAIRDGVSFDKLKQLFKLNEIDQERIALIKKLKVALPYFDNQMRFQPFQNAMSNNWVLAPEKTASGAPYMCVDPHLQVNRLPSSWYEVAGQWGEGNYQIGITLPGFPGWIMGKTSHLSASFTYGMIDTVDFFIEEVKSGKYKRGEDWIPLTVREERVTRKNKGKIPHYFFESAAGVIERENPESPLIEDGFYLSLAWAQFRQGPSANLNALMHLWSCKTVDEAQMYLWAMTLPCNWVIADHEGNIGLQQSGRVPKRKTSGLLPLPAWEEENLWQGFYMGTDLVTEINPTRGFCLSANDNKNKPDFPPFTTIHLPNYRYRRLFKLFSQNKHFTIEEMRTIQNDCYSIQAEELMDQLKAYLPATRPGKILKEWDYCYHKHSQGAFLFEVVYKALLKAVFSPIFGKSVWETYGPGHAFFSFNFGNFDQVLLSDDRAWFGDQKNTLFRSTIRKSLLRYTIGHIPTWGESNSFYMNYLLFDGRLPKFFGFDAGPIQLNGNRATVDTFQIFKEGKRRFVTSASYRFITDMGRHAVYTALAGGVSEKKRSPHYTSDIPLWKEGNCKQTLFDPFTNTFTSGPPLKNTN
jgi:penicillin G amidase